MCEWERQHAMGGGGGRGNVVDVGAPHLAVHGALLLVARGDLLGLTAVEQGVPGEPRCTMTHAPDDQKITLKPDVAGMEK